MRSFRGLAAALAVSALLPARTASAADCTQVTGTMVMPNWRLDVSPPLSLEPRQHFLWVRTGGPSVIALACADTQTQGTGVAMSASAVTGVLSFVNMFGASGSSYTVEDIVSGSGYVEEGATLSTALVTATASLANGGYSTAAVVGGGASMSYFRTGSVGTVVITLRGLTVDVDGAGPIPHEEWGDVIVTGAATFVLTPAAAPTQMVIEHAPGVVTSL